MHRHKDCCEYSGLASLWGGSNFLSLSKKIIEHGDRTSAVRQTRGPCEQNLPGPHEFRLAYHPRGEFHDYGSSCGARDQILPHPRPPLVGRPPKTTPTKLSAPSFTNSARP